MRHQLSQLKETENQNQSPSPSLLPSFPHSFLKRFIISACNSQKRCNQLARVAPDPHSPMVCLTSTFHCEPLHLFSFFLEFSSCFCYLLLICLIACTRRLLRSKFLKLVTEYNNGEVYDSFKQILKDHVQQRFFLSSAFSFMLK
jgi:hypothetical protein